MDGLMGPGVWFGAVTDPGPNLQIRTQFYIICGSAGIQGQRPIA